MSDTFQTGLRDAVAEARGGLRPPMTTRALPPTPISAPPARRAPDVPASKLKVAHRTVVNLWLPLTPLWVLLAPFALLFAPLMWLAPGKYRVRRPYRAALAIGGLLFAASGLKIDVDTPDAVIRIRIY
jgi:hypothetical protein